MIPRHRDTLLLSLLMLLAAGSCGRQGKLPTAASTPDAANSTSRLDHALAARGVDVQDGFYPLELGNRWHYVYTYTMQFRPGDGSTPPPPIVQSTTTELRLVCVEAVGGREYVVQRRTYKSGTRTFWTLFRQDRTGLYELWNRSRVAPECDATPPHNVSGSSPDFRAVETAEWERKIDGVHGARARDAMRSASPILEARAERFAAALGLGDADPSLRGPVGGASDSEATRLRYPLHPGASWNVYPRWLSRAWPLLAVVEGMDVISFPTGRLPAYRIRYTDETPGSGNGDVHVWYGRNGYLGMIGHSSYTIPGFDGSPPDTVVAEWSDVLDAIHLVAPPRRHEE